MYAQQCLNINSMFTLISNQGSMVPFAYLDHEDSWMNQYFNEEVLEQRICNETYNSKIMDFSNTFSDLPAENEGKVDSVEAQRRKNKSAFHNFQKHLLTLLKKVICVKKSELVHIPYGNRAYDLWRIFLGLKTSSKKNLYIIFGIDQRDNQSNLRKAAEAIPQLQRLLNKFDLRQIEQGQEVLRRMVCRQASAIEKIKLQCECKMKKFEQFYAYFLGFMEQLSEGVISRRMTKQRKIRLAKIQQIKQ